MREFWKGLKPRYRWAAGIATVVALWLATGLIFHPHTGPKADATLAKAGKDVPRVSVRLLSASNRNAMITLRGRTQALHQVDVRAEVEGVVRAIHFEKGDHVRAGQVLCEIKLNDRGAKLDMAQALTAQRAKEYEVAQKLYQDGFRSKTQIAEAQASLEAARAQQETQSIELENTRIKAPFDALVDDRYVDVGDYMKAGDKCAMLIAPTPFLVVGTLTEQDVGQIAAGSPASATLVTGETVNGKVRFVADHADQATRAFRVEVELPNPNGKLRDGISADMHIPVSHVQAAHISPGILVLDDKGVVGVRVVQNSVVHFVPIKVISDGPDGMWIAGLPDRASVITVGQEFVTDGEQVIAVPDKSGVAS